MKNLLTGILSGMMCLVLAQSAEAVVYVNANAAGANNGTSWGNAYTDLRTAISNTVSDEIWIAAGTYKPAGPGGDVLATFTLKNGIAIYGGFTGNETARDQRDVAENPTIFSGDLNGDDIYRYLNYHDGWWNLTDNSRHVVTGSNTDATAILDGVEITHGVGYRADPFNPVAGVNGGGLYISNGSPTISNCRFYGNGGANGGAVYILNGSPTFTNCSFVSNYADIGSGGAVYVGGYNNPAGSVNFDNCSFTRNAAVGSGSNDGDGGAIYVFVYSSVTVNGSTFTSNHSGHRTYSGGEPSTGGAITSYGALDVRDSLFIKNEGHWGGAMYVYGDATLVNSVFSRNFAYPTRFETLLSGGYGGAIILGGSRGAVMLSGVTISGNRATENAGGIYVNNARFDLVNSIVWGNTVSKYVGPGEDPIPVLKQQIHNAGAGDDSITYSDVQGLLETIPGEDPPDPDNFEGSIDSDPIFVDATNNDVRLTQSSPAIDAGDNEALLLLSIVTDLDGNARRYDDPVVADSGRGDTPVVDMGAYEFGSVPPDQLPEPPPGDQPPPTEPPPGDQPPPTEPPPGDQPPPTEPPPADEPDEPVEKSGTIDEVAVDSIVVSGITVLITTDTSVKFEDGTGGAFAIGQKVELKGVENTDGSITAIKIQVDG